MPHATPGLTARERLAARAVHYVAYTALFAAVYGGLRYWLGRVPVPFLLTVLLVSLAKDVYDEYRLARGMAPLAYAGVEHAPSNAVILAFVAVGVIQPPGTIVGVPTRLIVVALAGIDLLFDLSQDVRA